MQMRPKKNITRLQGTHQQIFAIFNESSDYPALITGEQINNYLTPEEKNKIADDYINSLTSEQKEELLSSHIEKINNQQIANAKQYYINGYYNTWFKQLKIVALRKNNDEQEKLVALTCEAYKNLCLDKKISIASEEFWKELMIKVRRSEKQDGAIDRYSQVKTPLTDIFTTTKNRAEQIIQTDQKEIKKLKKAARKQDLYNETIRSQVSLIDFAELGLILPYQTCHRSTQELTANFLETYLIYYINGNSGDKKEIINVNNKTAKSLHRVEKLLPTKNKATSHEKAKITLEQLTKLKEKQNGKN
ncbi:MAG TPA: hypothetical protein VKU36_05990 [Candidatus Babeliales bacterium]|nr:hypothetical protein [Candidatus Babeliales bacterium]